MLQSVSTSTSTSASTSASVSASGSATSSTSTATSSSLRSRKTRSATSRNNSSKSSTGDTSSPSSSSSLPYKRETRSLVRLTRKSAGESTPDENTQTTTRSSKRGYKHARTTDIEKSFVPYLLGRSNIGSHSAKKTKNETTVKGVKCEICKESRSPKSPRGIYWILCCVCKTVQAHITCVRNQLDKRHTRTVWKCLDCKPCFRCEEGRSENNPIVSCRYCKAPYHFKCALAHWKRVCVVCDKYHLNRKTQDKSASTSTSTSASVSAPTTASTSNATTTSSSLRSRKTRSATSRKNSLKSSTGDTSSPSPSTYNRETRSLVRLTRKSAGESTPDGNSQTSTRSSKRGNKHARTTAKKTKREVDDSEKKIKTGYKETKNEGGDNVNRSYSPSLSDNTSIPSGSQPQESQASIANDLDPDEPNVEDNVDLDNDDPAFEVSEPQGSVVPMDASIDDRPTHDENSSETPTDNKQNDEASPKMEIDTKSKAEEFDEGVGEPITNTQSDSNRGSNSSQGQSISNISNPHNACKDGTSTLTEIENSIRSQSSPFSTSTSIPTSALVPPSTSATVSILTANITSISTSISADDTSQLDFPSSVTDSSLSFSQIISDIWTSDSLDVYSEQETSEDECVCCGAPFTRVEGICNWCKGSYHFECGEGRICGFCYDPNKEIKTTAAERDDYYESDFGCDSNYGEEKIENDNHEWEENDENDTMDSFSSVSLNDSIGISSASHPEESITDDLTDEELPNIGDPDDKRKVLICGKNVKSCSSCGFMRFLDHWSSWFIGQGLPLCMCKVFRDGIPSEPIISCQKCRKTKVRSACKKNRLSKRKIRVEKCSVCQPCFRCGKSSRKKATVYCLSCEELYHYPCFDKHWRRNADKCDKYHLSKKTPLSGKKTKTETKAEDIKCEICKESCSPKSPKGPSISCHVCKTVQAHDTCVRNQLNKRHTRTVWKCLDCKPCFRCEEGRSENNNTVYCTYCKAPYHFKCASAHWEKGFCVVCDKYHPNKKISAEKRRELARKREIELKRAANAARSASTSASTSTSTSASTSASVSASASATASPSTATTTSTSTSVPTPEETKKSGASLLTGPSSSSRKTRSATSSNNSFKSSTGDTSSPSSSSSLLYKRENRALGRLRRSAGEQTPDENSQTSTRSSKRGNKHTRSTAKKAKRDVDSESNSGSHVGDSEKKIETNNEEEEEETKNERDDEMNRSSSSSLNDSTSILSRSQPQESQASIANDLDPDEPNVEDNVDLDNDDPASEVSEPQGNVVPMDASIDEQPGHNEDSSETLTDNKEIDEASPTMEIDTEPKVENLDEEVGEPISNLQSDSNSRSNSSEGQSISKISNPYNACKDGTSTLTQIENSIRSQSSPFSTSTSTPTSALVPPSTSATVSTLTANITSASTSFPTPEETKKSGASLLTGPSSSSHKTLLATSSDNSLKSSTGDTSSPSSSSSLPYKRETRSLARLRKSAGESTPDENTQTTTRSSKRGYKHSPSTAKKTKRDVDDSEKKIVTDNEGTKNEGGDKMNRSSSSLNDSTSIPSGSQPQESQASIANDLDPDEPNVEENVDLDNDDPASEVSEPQGSVVPMDASIDDQPTHDEDSSETPTDNKQNDEASSKMEIDTKSKAENLDEDADNKSVSDSQSVSNNKLDSSQDQLVNEAPKVPNARRDSTNAVNADNLLEKSETTNKSTTDPQMNGSDKAPSGVSSRIMKDANGSAKLKSALFERIYKVGGLLPAETSDWTVDDVRDFIKFLGFPKEAENFVTNQIDGKSLLLLTRQDVLTGFKMKLGPALKIFAHICLQRKKPSLLLEDQ